jgi:hypothetical protein
MDCDSALELAPSHVKANFRRAQALWRLGRREEALEAATKSFRAAETEAEEREARALAEAIEAGPWRRPGENVEGEENDEELGDPRDDGDEPPGTGAGAGTGTGTGAGTLLAASLGAGRSPEEETRRASFVSAAASALEAASLGGEEGAGVAGVSGARGGGQNAGVDALGTDGDDVYDLD